MKHGVCQSDVINNVGEAVNWSTFETHIYFSAPNSTCNHISSIYSLHLSRLVHGVHHLLLLDEHRLERVEVRLQVLQLHVRGRGVRQRCRHLVRSRCKETIVNKCRFVKHIVTIV